MKEMFLILQKIFVRVENELSVLLRVDYFHWLFSLKSTTGTVLKILTPKQML